MHCFHRAMALVMAIAKVAAKLGSQLALVGNDNLVSAMNSSSPCGTFSGEEERSD